MVLVDHHRFILLEPSAKDGGMTESGHVQLLHKQHGLVFSMNPRTLLGEYKSYATHHQYLACPISNWEATSANLHHSSSMEVL